MIPEYRFRTAPIALLLAILLPGLAVGLYLAVTGHDGIGFALSAVFAFGTVPAVRFLGLAEEHLYRAGRDALTAIISAPLMRTREVTVPWGHITGLGMEQPSRKGETAYTRLTVSVEGDKPLVINGDYPGFADWLTAVKKRVGTAPPPNRVK